MFNRTNEEIIKSYKARQVLRAKMQDLVKGSLVDLQLQEIVQELEELKLQVFWVKLEMIKEEHGKVKDKDDDQGE